MASSRAGYQRQKESVTEHYKLLDLAEAGEEEALADLMRLHIRSDATTRVSWQ
jgi:DNA-binding GntR family transcriptional regulator